MVLLSVGGVRISFGEKEVLTDLSFSLGERERMGVVGGNGAGKTTLLRLIARELEPLGGSITLLSGARVGFLRQNPREDPLLPGGRGGESGGAAHDGNPAAPGGMGDISRPSGEPDVFTYLLSGREDLLREEQELARLAAQMEENPASARGDTHPEKVSRGAPLPEKRTSGGSANVRPGEDERGEGAAALAARYAALQDSFTREGGYALRARARSLLRALRFSEEDERKPLTALSGGEMTRLSLGRVLFAAPDLLLLDEPTNHLDRETLAFLELTLREYPGAVIAVSHDRAFLDAVATKILDISGGRGKVYEGDYSAFAAKKAREREISERHYQNQQKEIARIEAVIARQRSWNREKSIAAAESTEKRLARMEKLARPDPLPANIKLRFTEALPSGEEVIVARDLRAAFDSRELFSGLSFTLRRGERLFILGENGCGKSTLLKILTGLLPPSGGSARRGAAIELGYYDQAAGDIACEGSVLDFLWDRFPRASATEIRSTLALFGFRGEEVFKEVSALSGGERARLTLANLSREKTNLLLLDEPTNHLDIPAREALEEALRAYGGTIVAVTHDRYFARLATRIIDFRTLPGCAYPLLFEGSYEEYTRFLSAREAEAETSPEGKSETSGGERVSPSKARYLEGKRDRNEARRRRARAREVKARTEQVERELTLISEQMSDPAAASDHVLQESLYERQTALEEELLALYEEAEAMGEE